MTEEGGQKPRRLRVSIRIKVLVLVSGVLLLAMGSYLSLATSLFTADKLAYIYDLNNTMVGSLSEQTRAGVLSFVAELRAFDRAAAVARDTGQEAAAGLFDRIPDVLEIRSIPGDGNGVLQVFANPKALDRSSLSREDLEIALGSHQGVLDALRGKIGYVRFQNISLPPDVPLLTVATATDIGNVVTAIVSPTWLLRIYTSSSLHDSFLLDESGRVLVHPDPSMVISARDLSRYPLVETALKTGVDRGVHEYQREDGVDFLGAYARVDVGDLWVLTEIPKEEALKVSRQLITRSVFFGIAILLAALIVSLVFSRLITAPIRQLRGATTELARGNFDIAIDVRSRDEIGELAKAFQAMARDLEDTQTQLIQSEKMAAFGQLGAGITHEVKNPMTGIVGFAQLAQRKLDDPEKVKELLQLIEREGLRCRDILVNFLKFAQTGTGDVERLDVNEVVEESCRMLTHQLSLGQVRLHPELGDGIAPVEGHAGEIKQVLLNLGMNAQQALPQGGNVWIRTRMEGDEVAIEVEDDGPGVPAEIAAKIFEPFFTTKRSGDGTGLGLSVSFGIIRSHRGRLDLSRRKGKGACFRIYLPVMHEDKQATAS